MYPLDQCLMIPYRNLSALLKYDPNWKKKLFFKAKTSFFYQYYPLDSIFKKKHNKINRNSS